MKSDTPQTTDRRLYCGDCATPNDCMFGVCKKGKPIPSEQRTEERPWYYGMSIPDLCVHLIQRDGPLTRVQLADRFAEEEIPIAASPRSAANEGVRRAVAKGQLIAIAKGIYAEDRRDVG